MYLTAASVVRYLSGGVKISLFSNLISVVGYQSLVVCVREVYGVER